MTLLVNEIHTVEGFKRTVLVAAADERLTHYDRKRSVHSLQPKLFEVPYLNGCVSFFGFATDGGAFRLWEFLPNFIRHHSDITDLATFSVELQRSLEEKIPRETLRERASGLHICGYGQKRPFLPDHYFLTNIRETDPRGVPTKLKDRYIGPGSNFLERDAKRLGWDGTNPMSAASGLIQIYRNGDFQVHALTSEHIDGIFKDLRALPDYRHPTTPEEYKTYMRFKLDLIYRIHKEWMRPNLVGGRPRVMAWTCNDDKVKKVE